MPTLHRLTVDGQDYLLPGPVSELKARILDAVRNGGDYVNVAGLGASTGIDLLFSPGMPVSWTVISVDDSPPTSESPVADFDLDL